LGADTPLHTLEPDETHLTITIGSRLGLDTGVVTLAATFTLRLPSSVVASGVAVCDDARYAVAVWQQLGMNPTVA